MYESKCMNPDCNTPDCCVPKCKGHKMQITSYKTDFYYQFLECKYCTLRLTIPIPSFIHASQHGDYLHKLKNKINRGEIDIGV